MKKKLIDLTEIIFSFNLFRIDKNLSKNIKVCKFYLFFVSRK
jgi:hypothetical protein